MAFKTGLGLAVDGEKEFKQALSDIANSAKVLKSEMAKVTAEFADNKDSQEALKSKSEVLNRQIDQQKDKINVLKSALQNAKDEYGENSTQVNKWQMQLNYAEADLAKLETQSRQTATQVNSLGNEIQESGNKTDIANPKHNLLEGAFNKIAIAAAAAGAAMVAMAKEVLDNADSVQQMSDMTGLSAEKIQELQYVGDNVGVSIDTMTGSFSKLIKNMTSASGGSGTAYEAFKKLGVSVTDSNGNLRDSNIVWQEAITALGNVKSETEQTSIAQQIFGKSAADLNPLIRTSADEINRMTNEAHKNGSVMSSETVASLDSFGDTMGNIKASILGQFGKALSDLPLKEISKSLKEIDFTPFVKAIGWMLENKSVTLGVISGIAAGVLAWKIQQIGLNIAMAANPIGALITLIIGIVAAVVTFLATNEDARKKISETFKAVGDWISNAGEAIKNFFTVIVPGWINTFINFIKNEWAAIGLFFINPVAGALKLLYDLNPRFREWVNDVKDKIVNGFSTAVDFIGSIPQKMLDIGRNIVLGLWNGIQEKIEWLKGKIKGLGDSVVNTLKDKLGIHSPSTVFAELGDFSGQGYIQGLQRSLSNASVKMSNNLLSSGSNAISNISNTTNNNYSAMQSFTLRVSDKDLSMAVTPSVSYIQNQSNSSVRRAYGYA